MNYRKDKRTTKEFAKDIKASHKVEQSLMQTYVDYLNSLPGIKCSFFDTGCDNSGKYIPLDKNVNLNPDFTLDMNGNKFKVEIKHCFPDKDRFHLKVKHVQNCVKKNITIVNFMNVEGNARFCVLSPKILQYYLKFGEKSYFWQKECIRLNCNDFNWINCEPNLEH